MADPWELILFHTYTGTPGVICDQSPGRGSHGVAVNLPDSDFFTDGIAAGSGAVAFEPNSSIRVAASKSWSPLNGLRAEVICVHEPTTADNTLIDGGRLGSLLAVRISARPSVRRRIRTPVSTPTSTPSCRTSSFPAGDG